MACTPQARAHAPLPMSHELDPFVAGARMRIRWSQQGCA
jgi:hypothetical protein